MPPPVLIEPAMLMLPAPPGLTVKLSTSPPATLSVILLLSVMLLSAVSVSDFVPRPLKSRLAPLNQLMLPALVAPGAALLVVMVTLPVPNAVVSAAMVISEVSVGVLS